MKFFTILFIFMWVSLLYRAPWQIQRPKMGVGPTTAIGPQKRVWGPLAGPLVQAGTWFMQAPPAHGRSLSAAGGLTFAGLCSMCTWRTARGALTIFFGGGAELDFFIYRDPWFENMPNWTFSTLKKKNLILKGIIWSSKFFEKILDL